MLEVRVEVIPFGDETKRELLDKLVIINTGKHPNRPALGHYICHHADGSFIIPEHIRADGYWSLIRKCLDEYLD